MDLASGKWWMLLQEETEPSVEKTPKGSQLRTRRRTDLFAWGSRFV